MKLGQGSSSGFDQFDIRFTTPEDLCSLQEIPKHPARV